MTHRTALPRFVLAPCLLSVSACATTDDDDSAAPSTTTAEAAEISSLCETWVEVDQVSSELGGPETPPEQVTAVATQLRDLIDGVDDAPAELDDSIASLSSATGAAADGDPSQLETEATVAAVAAVGAWVHESCGFSQAELIYRDYAFEGMPEQLAAGPVSFRATSDAKEMHVMVIVRMADDVEGDPAAVVRDAMMANEGDPFEALAGVAEPVISGAFAPPGGTAMLTADLEAGTYVVICPIPTGFTGDGPPPPDAPSHAMNGMIATVAVL